MFTGDNNSVLCGASVSHGSVLTQIRWGGMWEHLT